MKKTLLVIALVLAVGCKKDKDKEMAKDKPAGGSAMAGSGAADTAHGPHHQRVAAELAKFQEALGEKWHAPKGEQRMKDACAAVPQMESMSAEAAKVPVPKGVEEAKWTASMKELEASITELKGSCGGTELAKFEPAFDKAHNAFHALIGMTGGHHEADGTHQHQM